MIVIGIDPGVETGLAVWNVLDLRFLAVESGDILEVMQKVLTWRDVWDLQLLIFEDARLRTWFSPERDEKQQKYGAGVREGVGSVKRDCGIWETFCIRHEIRYEAKYPSRTKYSPEEFQRLTGWQGQTNVHKRDAGMIVHGLNRPMLQGKLLTLEHAPVRPHTDRKRSRPGKPRGRGLRGRFPSRSA